MVPRPPVWNHATTFFSVVIVRKLEQSQNLKFHCHNTVAFQMVEEAEFGMRKLFRSFELVNSVLCHSSERQYNSLFVPRNLKSY